MNVKVDVGMLNLAESESENENENVKGKANGKHGVKV
jgi:hypothetical protein